MAKKSNRNDKRRDSSGLAVGAFSIGAVLVAAGAAGVAWLARRNRGSAEHVPTDLMRDTHPGPNDRAIDAFRPDPTAPIPPGERDQFRPALAGGEAPTLVAGQARDLQTAR